jgi:hypothetical protein
MEQWKDILKKCVEEAGAKFEKNELGGELAFLALQGKIELQLRDKIAWLLQQYYGDKYYIKKEYKRCDLAILNKEFTPLCLVEFKAHSATNFNSSQSQLEEYQEYFKNDLAKMQDLKKGSNAELFYIFFQTIHTKQIEKSHNELIPYFSAINGGIKKGGNVDKLIEEKWEEMCSDIDGEITRCEDIEAGEYLGYTIKIATMIFGPKQ